MTRPPAPPSVEGRAERCVGCERYRSGIAQITEDYEAEIARLHEALREAWANG